MGMSSASGSKKGAVPVMNVTPLVDVVLVLLIIFMVVTPLLSKQFWLHLPKKDDTQAVVPPSVNNENIVVTVDRAGAIRVNRTEIPKAEFRERVARMIAARSDKTVYFDAENGTPYGLAVEAMDLSRAGGAKTIAILTDLK